MIEKRTLGTNGPSIPALMFGAWPIGGGMGTVDEAVATATIRQAIDRGIVAIDTAEYYRTSESVIGNALVGLPREQIFLATKVSTEPFTQTGVRVALENSLHALRTDYVDLYQLHSFPKDLPLEEAMAGLAAAQRSGKARYVGVSNFTIEQLDRARRIYPIQSLQPRFNLFDVAAADDLIPYCYANGVGVIAHSPLAKGLLAGTYRPGHVFPADDERRQFPRFQGEAFVRHTAAVDALASFARQRNVSLVQLAIAWTLAHPGVTAAIVGAKSPKQIDEQPGALDLRLSPDDVAQLRTIAAQATAAK